GKEGPGIHNAESLEEFLPQRFLRRDLLVPRVEQRDRLSVCQMSGALYHGSQRQRLDEFNFRESTARDGFLYRCRAIPFGKYLRTDLEVCKSEQGTLSFNQAA